MLSGVGWRACRGRLGENGALEVFLVVCCNSFVFERGVGRVGWEYALLLMSLVQKLEELGLYK